MRHVLSLPLILALGALVGCTQERITGGPRSIDIQHPLADVAVVPNPTVVGPIAATALPGDPLHAYPFFSTAVDLAVRGYVEAEFYIEGTANRYTLPDRATASVIDGGHAYRTRIVVRRPAATAAFNGTVIME